MTRSGHTARSKGSALQEARFLLQNRLYDSLKFGTPNLIENSEKERESTICVHHRANERPGEKREGGEGS